VYGAHDQKLLFGNFFEFKPEKNSNAKIFSEKLENFQIQKFFLGKKMGSFPRPFLEILDNDFFKVLDIFYAL